MPIQKREKFSSLTLKESRLMKEQPELTKENSPRGVVSRISNRLHNIGCEHQDSELGEELGGMACDMWEVLPMISNEEPQEKQPEYEYTKVKSVFELDREDSRNGVYGELYKGEFYPATSETDLVHTLMNDKLSRRVEITPEVKREREVEELAKFMSNLIDRGNDYFTVARASLEWMESKK